MRFITRHGERQISDEAAVLLARQLTTLRDRELVTRIMASPKRVELAELLWASPRLLAP